jgi:signal transduction histidine kinase
LSFRARLIGAVVAITLVALGAALSAIFWAVSSSERSQLDSSLLSEAHEEAGEVATMGGGTLVIGAADGPVTDDLGPLTKYAAIYDADGGVIDSTDTFGGSPPNLSDLPDDVGEPFDTVFRNEPLRAVLVPVPDTQGKQLLLAAPRTHLERDERFLWRTLILVLCGSGVWATLVATGVVWRLTRHHQAIADVAQRVAQGDLSARVPTVGAAGETGRMVLDINEMIARLEALVTSQRRFIAYASHELRSPLSVLYGELSLALRKPREESDYREAIQSALESTRQLKQLAEDLLTLARVADSYHDDASVISLPSLLQAAIRSVEQTRGLRADWVTLDLCDAYVRGNERDLQRLFFNLLDNAQRYTPEGKQVHVRARRELNGVKVWIIDEGPGIAEEDRERVFEPFYRSPQAQASEFNGAGLGLAIVREIALAHGGSVRVLGPEERDPSWGAGACLLVQLVHVASRPG